MNKAYLAGLLVLAGASSAFAADMPVKARVAAVPYVQYNYILAANNQIILQAVGTHLDYAEYADGRTGLPAGAFMDGEKGWVPGVGLKLSVMSNWLFENAYFSAEGAYQKGNLDYKQQIAPGVIIGDIRGPAFNAHEAELNDFSLRFGKGFTINPNVMITPFAEYGYHRWVRHQGLPDETYQHQYVGGGVLLQVSPVERLVWSASAMVGSTFSAQIDVGAVPAVGLVGAQGIGLGSAVTWKVGTGLDYALTPNWHVSGDVSYMEFDYGKSADVNAGILFFEPRSTSKVTTAKLGIGYSWGGASAVVAKY
jgi:hypothetical protein